MNERQISKSERASVLSAASNTLSFDSYFRNEYRDLGDFLKQISQSAPKGISVQVLSEVSVAITKLVVANNVGTTYTRATGVSFWLPTDADTYLKMSSNYKSLQFNRRTGWSAALESLFQP